MSNLKILRSDELTRQICVVVGTRPSLVKQSAVMRELTRQEIPFFLLHAGQHYSYELDGVFFRDLQIPEPRYRIETTPNYKYHGAQTAEMLRGIEEIMLEEKPKGVLVGGDANCNLAGALAARKLQVSLCHEEAGMRGYDWLVPEEHNRVMIDHISDYLFAPNEEARSNLEGEKVRGRIFVTGTPIVDSVEENLAIAREKSDILQRLRIQPDGYILLTMHREETVDYKEVLAELIEGVRRVAVGSGLPIVFPAHPRTVLRLGEFGLTETVDRIPGLTRIPPAGYFDFLTLLGNARLVMTESGGTIQESSILRVPCVTLSGYTEWHETERAGANLVSGQKAEQILAAAEEMLSRDRNWPNPFGKSGRAKAIADILGEKVLGG